MPAPPYYAVVFASQASGDDAGYAEMDARVEALARAQPGFLGLEAARDASGFGITVSYWRDEASILAWKAEAEHLAAQRMGVARWYARYEVRVAKVERAYGGPAGRVLWDGWAG